LRACGGTQALTRVSREMRGKSIGDEGWAGRMGDSVRGGPRSFWGVTQNGLARMRSAPGAEVGFGPRQACEAGCPKRGEPWGSDGGHCSFVRFGFPFPGLLDVPLTIETLSAPVKTATVMMCTP